MALQIKDLPRMISEAQTAVCRLDDMIARQDIGGEVAAGMLATSNEIHDTIFKMQRLWGQEAAKSNEWRGPMKSRRGSS
jgi:hypothetical protein